MKMMGEKVDKGRSGGENLDEVLMKFDIFGRYYISLLLWFVVLGIIEKMPFVNFVFGAESVAYRCKDFGNNETCDNFNSTHRCLEWEYDNPDSFVAEFNLACQEWKRTLVGTVHSLGFMLGLILTGPLSDRIGRKSAIIVTAMAGGFVGLVKSFVPWYWVYVALEFLEAVVGDAFSPIYMLAVEMVATKNRVIFVQLSNIGFPLGGAILPLVAWLFPYWRSYLKVIYAPALLFFVYKYLLDESVRWLLANGRKEEAVAILKKAAKMNKIQIDDAVLEKLTCDVTQENTTNLIKLLKNTFASSALFRRFLICTVWWITSTFVNYGMMINSVTLQGDKYWNFSIMFLIDIPGVFINTYILSVFKRKYALMSYFFIGAVLCVIQPFVPTHVTWLSVSLYMIGKLMSTFYFDTTYLLTSELFPTYTRNSMHALCSSLGRIGSVIAPQTPLLMVYWSGIPTVLFGGMALLAAILTCFVPDTADDALPDTIEQAEGIGNKSTKLTQYNVPGKFGSVKNEFEISQL